MSGATYLTHGGPGAASTARYFGALLPDLINMLVPGHWQSGVAGGNMLIDLIGGAAASANFGNQWTPYNTSFDGGANVQTASFGSSVSAPDGTNTGTLVVEDSSTNKHYILCGTFSNSIIVGAVRLAAILKAGTRTRAVMEVSVGTPVFGAVGATGVNVCFDLAGGQIGAGPTGFGSTPFTALGQSITPLGGGWYLCTFDVQADVPPAILGAGRRFAIYLDNGSGTGAQSISYTGNGTGNIAIWRTNALPPAAYAINSTDYFDGFDYSPSQVPVAFDLNDTRAPGFKWYLHAAWPRYGSIPTTAGNLISVAGSVLSIIGDPGGNNRIKTDSYTGDIGGSAPFYQGYTTQLPALFRGRYSWVNAQQGASNSGIAYWTADARILSYPLASPPDLGPLGREMDFNESALSTGDNVSRTTLISYSTRGTDVLSGRSKSIPGIVPYLSNFVYSPGEIVASGGSFYSAISSVPVSTPPPNATYWASYSNVADWLVSFDFTQMHNYDVLVLPYTSSDYGHVMCFCDGIMTGNVCTYGPTLPSNISITTNELSGIMQQSDGSAFGLFLSGGAGDSTFLFNVDSVTVLR